MDDLTICGSNDSSVLENDGSGQGCVTKAAENHAACSMENCCSAVGNCSAYEECCVTPWNVLTDTGARERVDVAPPNGLRLPQSGDHQKRVDIRAKRTEKKRPHSPRTCNSNHRDCHRIVVCREAYLNARRW
ncbi:hypothetical protein LIA77_05644 [Sarocladium implicatum]|nr:hypothetical protein LIA77_05644 [Sarocladium implicatum]